MTTGPGRCPAGPAAVQAPSVVKVRLSGGARDIEALTAILASVGAEIIERSGPRRNRRDPGERMYLTVRTEKSR